MLARWIVYPHVAVRRAMSNPDELLAYAILPIALMTIAGLTATQVSTASWGGHSFTLVAYVLWWIGCAWVFITSLVVFPVLFHTGNQADRVMTPVLFMAPVGLATAAAEVGAITTRACCMSARLAVPMIVVGYFATGTALLMAIVLYTIYFHRLLASGWTVPAKRPGMFILVCLVSIFGATTALTLTNSDRSMRTAGNGTAKFRTISIRIPSIRRLQAYLSRSSRIRHHVDSRNCTRHPSLRHPARHATHRSRLPLVRSCYHRSGRHLCQEAGRLLVGLVEYCFPYSNHFKRHPPTGQRYGFAGISRNFLRSDNVHCLGVRSQLGLYDPRHHHRHPHLRKNTSGNRRRHHEESARRITKQAERNGMKREEAPHHLVGG